jgi:hypothetical protein
LTSGDGFRYIALAVRAMSGTVAADISFVRSAAAD